MREALRGLTTRGRSFLAAAAAAALSALILGEKDLLRVAVLLAVLPLLAALYVGRSRYRLACTRSLEPHRVQAGSTSRVVLRLQNLSRLPTGTLLLEDRLPYALGSRPRVVLERLGAHQGSSVAYTVRADVRGRYEVGPLTVRLTDPFGLCELTRAFPSTDRLTVIPQVLALPNVRVAGEYAGTGDSRARSVAVHGDDDAATREYRHGDDLRRVHWKSTARTGELMVRREEQPWESRATVVLDTRAAAHRGEGPTASFEWAVSAAASIAVHLRRAGYKMRLVTGPEADLDASDAGGEGLLLDHLAQVRTAPRVDLGLLVERVRQRNRGGLVVAVLGTCSATEAELVRGLRDSGVACIGFLIDSTTWVNLGQPARGEADEAHEASALTLLEGGWKVIGVEHGMLLPGLWPQVARRAQGFARRAAMAETVSGGMR
ncbi:DUF58 domain-containing protein [Plantactinospora sp. KBS50]|uniref:DUF58 domain-containing protein n=1 Tax=Plantactinospora sp. KBS50 TaxID=2024580 RepID=UPI000BAAFAA3|nr:DUF58 domain-containing protein [Plantactinospora sp. KBS50]ASW56038.1 DUF58 domain-containing protein [Plantactinospora sp. KBS50]